MNILLFLNKIYCCYLILLFDTSFFVFGKKCLSWPKDTKRKTYTIKSDLRVPTQTFCGRYEET